MIDNLIIYSLLLVKVTVFVMAYYLIIGAPLNMGFGMIHTFALKSQRSRNNFLMTIIPVWIYFYAFLASYLASIVDIYAVTYGHKWPVVLICLGSAYLWFIAGSKQFRKLKIKNDPELETVLVGFRWSWWLVVFAIGFLYWNPDIFFGLPAYMAQLFIN